jgi:hypothetical protein
LGFRRPYLSWGRDEDRFQAGCGSWLSSLVASSRSLSDTAD